MEYTVDRANRITSIDEDWDRVAERSVPVGPLSATIVGRPLEDFLAGDATKMFVRSAFDAVRLLGRSRVLPYRCDSPDERRCFEMHITPLEQGGVRVAHHLVCVEKRKGRPVVEKPAARAGWRCSQCMAVRHTGTSQWVEAEGFIPLAQDVCPRCARQLFEPPASTAGPGHE